MDTDNEVVENFPSNDRDKPLFITTKDGSEYVLIPKAEFEKLSAQQTSPQTQHKFWSLTEKIIKYLEPKDLPF